MKRREFLKAGGVGLAASAVAAPAIAQSIPEVNGGWRQAGRRRSIRFMAAANTSPSASPNHRQQIPDPIVRRRRTRAGLAGPRRGSNGTVEMGNTALYYYWGKNPPSPSAPLCRSGSTPARILPGCFRRRHRHAQRPPEGIQHHGIPTGSTGAQMGGWFRKEIKSMDDFRGLKFRVGGFAGTIIAKVGGVPQQIAAGDIYPALEKGTIDAAEWVGPYDDEKLGFVKVAKYYYYPGWWEGTGQGHNVINMDKWNPLPKHYQATLECASRDTFAWVTGNTIRQPAGAEAADRGRRDPETVPAGSAGGLLQRRQRDLCGPVQDQPPFRQDVSSLSAFRSDSPAWMQVAELSYDSFMMRMRTRT